MDSYLYAFWCSAAVVLVCEVCTNRSRHRHHFRPRHMHSGYVPLLTIYTCSSVCPSIRIHVFDHTLRSCACVRIDMRVYIAINIFLVLLIFYRAFHRTIVKCVNRSRRNGNWINSVANSMFRLRNTGNENSSLSNHPVHVHRTWIKEGKDQTSNSLFRKAL